MKTVVLGRRGAPGTGGRGGVGTGPGPGGAPRGSPLVPGAEVGGRYRIERLLGMGGMARVWLAEDREQRMPVAFKEMLVPKETSGAELEESTLLFRREYYAMKKLQHPGTVRVFDCGVMETGNRYITMEVVSGEDLCDVAARQPMSYRDVHHTLTRMAQILGFVHSRLFVHCDVKAENVRITAVGDVKLMDFGIMHPLGTRASGKVWGTPEYMAPEWHERGIIDGRSDLYSLGVLAFFLLTQTTPFCTQEMAGAVLADDLAEPARALAEQPNHHPELAAIVLRLIERDPRSRFANAAELVSALCAMSGEAVDEEPLAARASYLHLPVVVGRRRETEALAARLDGARLGEARALLLGAPAGVGKSRLIQELELEARDVDMPFALGQCRAEGLTARAPIEQALRALIPATPAALLEPLRPTLAKLFPALGPALPRSAEPAAAAASATTAASAAGSDAAAAASAAPAPPRTLRDASDEKMAVFEALSRWLRGLAELQPFVLCLEDLHWADSATLETMNVIIRALHKSRGLVLGTFRSDELSRISLAFQTVDEQLADSLEIAPLSEEDLMVLVSLTLQGFRHAGPLAKRLYQATGGNVFFATECLRALIEEGRLQRRLGSWIATDELAEHQLPRSIKDVVLARLSTLRPEQVAFFRRLATAGRVLDMPLLQALGDVEPTELFQLLDEGVERQFLQYSEGRYFFVHATVHEAIYESTPPEVRRRSHGRIAEHLLATSGQTPEAARAIGYHFARSLEPARAISPLGRAASWALENKAMLEAFSLLEEAAGLLEDHPEVPDRDERLIAAWGQLVEVAYTSNTPACLRYAQKLFQHWDATVDLARGRAEVTAQLHHVYDEAEPASRGELLTWLFRERPMASLRTAEDVFLKRAEFRILESIALAITGRTAEFAAGLTRTAEDHPAASPYRAAASIAIGGLTSHTGHFRGAVAEMRRHVGALRDFTAQVTATPRRLEWALGMGAYFMNMNLALMGTPLDPRATADGFAIADRLGFAELRIYHLFSQIVRASFIGDGAAFQPPFVEMNELMRKLGNPRLPERNLAIYTPPYYLERGELELLRAVVQKGERLSKILPGDRWLKLYVQVYRVCLHVAAIEHGGAAPGSERDAEIDAEIDEALAQTRASDFRMETLVWVYKARLERARGQLAAARRSAATALERALDPLRANPFDEILARRALAELSDETDALAELGQALALAERTGNVLQEGIIRLSLRLALAERQPEEARAHLQLAEARFRAARAERWLQRARAHSEFAD